MKKGRNTKNTKNSCILYAKSPINNWIKLGVEERSKIRTRINKEICRERNKINI